MSIDFIKIRHISALGKSNKRNIRFSDGMYDCTHREDFFIMALYALWDK